MSVKVVSMHLMDFSDDLFWEIGLNGNVCCILEKLFLKKRVDFPIGSDFFEPVDLLFSILGVSQHIDILSLWCLIV